MTTRKRQRGAFSVWWVLLIGVALTILSYGAFLALALNIFPEV